LVHELRTDELMADDAFDALTPPDETPHMPGVLAMTDRPLPIDVMEIEADPIPEGMICVGTFIEGKLVARCLLPEGAMEQFALHGFFTEPRQLVLAAREADPGLRCELYAIVPLPRDLTQHESEEAEPWLTAADSHGYERAVGDPEVQIPEGAQAAVLLGQIVRFQRDRKHPDSLPLETVDVLARIVSGRVVSVVDKVLEDLLGPGGG
jgi:hypothetical protein